MSRRSSIRVRGLLYAAWITTACPAVCFANVGVPMIFWALPTMAMALVPIIVVETALALPYLRLSLPKLLKASALANVVSTFVGIPVTWFLLVVIQIITGGGRAYGVDTAFSRFLAVTWQAPWLVPYDGDLFWMVPAAALMLLIPFFFASWALEYAIMKRILKGVDTLLLWRTARNVNFLSYSGLALYIIVRTWLY